MSAPSAGNGGISIAAGIIIGLFASCIQSLGLTIQRKSHVLNQALPDDLQRVEHRQPLWLLGFLIFITSNILGSLFQIASLPVLILAPLGAVSLICNAFFAYFILGHVFSLWMVLGTFLITGGAVLIAIFGIVPESAHSLEDLLVLFSRPAFVAYFTLLGFAVLMCLAITHLAEYSYTRRLCNRPPSRPSSPLMIRTESLADLTTERTPLLVRKRVPGSSAASTVSATSSSTQRNAPRSRTPLFLSISYASTSGILSGMCLIFAKSGVELLLISIHGSNQFWRYEAWMLILGVVGFALLQLWYLNKALKLADPTIVCPLAFCFYNLSSIVNSLVYFDQVALLPVTHILFVILGIFILLGGVWAVSLQAVNVDTWNGGDEVDVPLIEDEATDEDSLPECVPSPAPPVSQSPEREHVRAHSDSPTSPPPSPLSPRRRATHSHGPNTIGGTNPISSPPSAVPAPFFSIGLSPASPGFVLVPRERRRSTNAQPGDPWVEAIRRVRSRRVVSDTNALAGEDIERGLDQARPGENENMDSHGRWAWLRRLIVRRKDVSS